MRKVFAFFFIMCMSQTAWCDHQLVRSNKFPFKVEISINDNSLKTDFYKKVGLFYIDTKITNISATDQAIIVWTQQGWSWISDNLEVTPGIEAAQNVLTRVTLKPNEKYKGRVEMFSNSQKTRPVAFRLGFFPQATRPISGQPGMEKSEGIIWSNTVRLAQ